MRERTIAPAARGERRIARGLWIAGASALASLLLLEASLALLGRFPAPPPRFQAQSLGEDGVRFLEAGGAEILDAERAAPAGMLRIVVLGDSTIYGSFLREVSTIPRMLEVLLSQATPVRWQALNLGRDGLSAAQACELGELALEHVSMDLLVLYTGHNEFLPPHLLPFVDAHARPLRSGLARRMRWSRVGRALADRLEPPAAARGGEHWTRSGYAVGILERSATAAVRPRVLDALQRRLERFARRAAARGVPVILAGPASNGREYGPLGSALSRPLAPPELERYLDRLREAAAELRAGRLEGCAAAIEAAGAIDPDVAELVHLRASLAWARGEQRDARELDLLKWSLDESARAASGEVIRRIERAARATAQRFVALGPLLERLPEPAEPRSFLDNVHPSVYGQFLMARALARECALALAQPLEGPWPAYERLLAAVAVSPELAARCEAYTLLGDVNYACWAFDPEPYQARAREALAGLADERRSETRFQVAELLLALLDEDVERAIELAAQPRAAKGGAYGMWLAVAGRHPRLRAALERAGLEILPADPWLRRVE